MRVIYAIPVVFLVLALGGPWLADHPNQINLEHILQSPNTTFLLGTDDLGRSVLQRLVAGAQISALVAIISVSISAMLGISIGLVAGYFGGIYDRIISRIIEIFLAFPGLLLAIALAAMLGPGIENVIVALSLMGWVGYARLVRVQVMSLKQREHVFAAKALGRGDFAVMRLHLLPLVLAPVWVEVSYGIAGAVIAEAGLSFLGLGVQPPQASWGGMIKDGVRYLLVAPHLVLAPGIALSLLVLAVNLIGDDLRDRLDVVSKSRR